MQSNQSIENILDTKIKNLEPSFRAELINRYNNDEKFKSLTNEQKLRYIKTDIGIDKLPNGASLTSRHYYRVRGYDENGIDEQIKKHFSTRNNRSIFSLSLWLEKGYSEEEALKEIRSRRIFNLEFWLKQGYSEKEAKEKRNEFQKEQSRKGNKSIKVRCTQIEYWLQKGFSEEEAKEKLKERQQSHTANRLIKKKGLRAGLLQFLKRKVLSEEVRRLYLFCYKICDKTETDFWKNVKQLTKEKRGHASKESLLFLEPLYYALKDTYTIFIGAFGLQEYKIYYNNKSNFFRYDFVLLESKIIIEYDGQFFHGEPENLRYSKFSDNKDELKEQLANEHGFKLYRLNSLDSFQFNVNKIITIIKENNIEINFESFKIYKKFYKTVSSYLEGTINGGTFKNN